MGQVTSVYTWPIGNPHIYRGTIRPVGNVISGTACEYRSTHFHMGIQKFLDGAPPGYYFSAEVLEINYLGD